MSKFIVEGGRKLKGTVRVQGSKNAAFPVIAAALLASGPSEIANVPRIGDLGSTLRILKHLRVKYFLRGHVLTIDPRGLRYRALPAALTAKFRGSVVFAGALLGRFGAAKFALPGGDMIGSRPIDVHLDGFRQMGAKVAAGPGSVSVNALRLRGARIVMGVPSVTGTENLVLAAARAHGRTEIKLAACEPHVQALCRYLNKMGARISGIGTPDLTIHGVAKLHPADFALPADEIAAITWAAAAAATRGDVTIRGVNPKTLDAPLAALERMGVNCIARDNTIRIRPRRSRYQPVRVLTGVYPQLLTDYQPLFGVLATQAAGTSRVHDWIYEGRQGYLRELRRMGAQVKLIDIHRALITGPALLHGAKIATPDIRAGASVLIAALIAKGRSIIYNAEIIDRGYERIDEKLRQLGAKIERVE